MILYTSYATAFRGTPMSDLICWCVAALIGIFVVIEYGELRTGGSVY